MSSLQNDRLLGLHNFFFRECLQMNNLVCSENTWSIKSANKSYVWVIATSEPPSVNHVVDERPRILYHGLFKSACFLNIFSFHPQNLTGASVLGEEERFRQIIEDTSKL